MANKKIIIVDDHAMFRSGLRMLLEASLQGAGVTEAGSLNEAMQGPDAEPDVVLLDIKLPGLNGVEGIALLRRQWANVPIVMLSSQDDPETVREALARGATVFVSKAETADRIVALVNRILHEGLDSASPAGEPARPTVRLTPRQCEVLELLCQGLSNKLIARRLNLSENTVRWHVQAILEALGVSSRSAAAFAARSAGLVS